MCRIARPRAILLVILSAAVAAVIATVVSQKQQLQVMDEAERRQYLGGKLEGRISDEQIDRLAAAVSARLDSAQSATEPGAEGESESDSDSAEEPPTDS